MNTYYITAKNDSNVGQWDKIQAKSLTHAKQICTIANKGEWLESTLLIADEISNGVHIVASKRMTAKNWTNN